MLGASPLHPLPPSLDRENLIFLGFFLRGRAPLKLPCKRRGRMTKTSDVEGLTCNHSCRRPAIIIDAK